MIFSSVVFAAVVVVVVENIFDDLVVVDSGEVVVEVNDDTSLNTTANNKTERKLLANILITVCVCRRYKKERMNEETKHLQPSPITSFFYQRFHS
jgi:ABC-type oligopeptide transport system ATPase subunit